MSETTLKTGASPAQNRADNTKSEYGLENIGLINLNQLYWNLSTEALTEEIIFRSEGRQAKTGSVIINSGDCRCISIIDKFIVREASTENKIWWGEYNRPFSEAAFNALYYRMQAFVQKRDLFIQDCYVGAGAGGDSELRLPIRIITEHASHSLFARNMFFQPEGDEDSRRFVPEFTIIDIPSFKATAHIDSTLSSSFMIHDFDKKLCLIGNSRAYWEIKNAVNAIMNFLLPQQNILTLRSSASTGKNGDSALFIGSKSGGKFALTLDNNRNLIGDAIHGWTDDGLCSLNNGCYSDLKSLTSDENKPAISNLNRPGTIFENVDPDTDFGNGRFSDNARASYPLKFLENSVTDSMSAHPQNLFLVTCDSTGVLPPIAKLTPEQAVYYFLSGYFSKIDDPAIKDGREPEAVFSPCFNAPLIINDPYKLARIFGEKVTKYETRCWMINTGWSGGSFATGKQIDISFCREAVACALDGSLNDYEFYSDPVFGFEIPKKCGSIPPEILLPEKSAKDAGDYRKRQKQLAMLFIGNFNKFAAGMPENIIKAGPSKTK